MCSPSVAAIVRNTLRSRETRVTRRALAGRAGAAAMATAAMPILAVAHGATPMASPITPIMSIHDLTHVASPDYPMFPGATPMQIDLLVTIEEDGFYKNTLTLDEHTARCSGALHTRRDDGGAASGRELHRPALRGRYLNPGGR